MDLISRGGILRIGLNRTKMSDHKYVQSFDITTKYYVILKQRKGTRRRVSMAKMFNATILRTHYSLPMAIFVGHQDSAGHRLETAAMAMT